jgi:hypothetical protein
VYSRCLGSKSGVIPDVRYTREGEAVAMTTALHIDEEMAPQPRLWRRTRALRGRITLAESPELYLREEMG